MVGFAPKAIGTLFIIIVSLGAWAHSKGLSSLPPSAEPSVVIHHPRPRLLDGFGMSVSQHHGQILVGAPNAVNQGQETGITFLFDLEGNLVHTFEIPVKIPVALFGQAVALSPKSVIIGAPHGRDELETQTGVVYLFDRNTKKLRLTLNNPLPTSGVFGHALAVDEQRVLVGDPQASTATTFRKGAVYMFHEATGALQRTFRPKAVKVTRPTQFGQVVSVVGHHIFISAPFGGSVGSEAGMVYQFDGHTGNLVRTFEPPKTTRSLFFGWSFATNDRAMLIGAFGFQGTYREEGIAYLYDVQSGKLLKTLKNPSPTERARFGKSVALTSDYLIVAAPGDRYTELGNIEGGVVYLFERESGTLVKTFRDPLKMTGASDVFGQSLFSKKGFLLVGAPFGGIGKELDAGVVYQFQTQKSQ